MRTEGLKAIAAGVLCAALAGCAARGIEETYTDTKKGFEIVFPRLWGAWQDKNGVMIATHRRVTTGAAKVTVTTVEEGAGLRSFFQNPRNRFDLLGYELTGIQKCTVAGTSALKLEVVAPVDPDRTRITLYYLVSGGR